MYYEKRIDKEITPSRLRSLLKLVSRDYYTEKELGELLQPAGLNKDDRNNKGDQSIFKKVFNFALEAKLIIEEENGFVRLNIARESVFDDDEFKKIMKDTLMGNKVCLFYRITSWVLKQDKSIIKVNRKEDLLTDMLSEGVSVTGEDMLAWRFWFKYLGYGYNLRDEFIIPNPFKRIEYLIKKEMDLVPKKNITFRDFITKLIAKAPEFTDSINNNSLSFALSLALRTLDSQNKIKLINIVDASDIWHLDKMEYQLNQVTHISLGR